MKARQAVSVILVLAMCLSFMTAFAETTDYTNTDYYETVVDTITYDDLAADSTFRAEESNGNVFYKVNATTGYLHSGDQYADKMFEKSLVNGGEYMIEYKAYTYGISHTARNASYGTYLKHDDSGSDYPMLGFKLDVTFGTADYKQVLVTPNFHFRYGKRSAGETLVNEPIGDAFYLNAATWYTFRYIYNLDTQKATMQIYDVTGTTLVKEITYDMPDTVPGKEYPISYDNMKFYYLNATAKIIWVGIDDFKIVRTAAKPVTVNYDPEKVTVSYEGKEVKNGEAFPVPYNSTTPAKFTVTPKGTNEVSKVLVNGEEIAGTTSFELTAVKGDTTIDILVKGAPEVKSVAVSGRAMVGEVLTAAAVITDGDGDDTSATYQWEYLEGTEWKSISGATDKEYEVAESVLGKQLRVVVTPFSDKDPKEGTPYPSTPTEAVVPYQEPAESEWIQEPMTYEDQEGVSLDSVTETGEYIIDEGENNYWLAKASGDQRMKAFYLIPENRTMGTSGEYIISHDTKFGAVGATVNVQSIEVPVFYTKSTSTNPNCFMGFGIAPSNVTGTNTVKSDISFHYRWREPGAGSDTVHSFVVSDEPWVFNPDEWYTFKHVYNLDSSPKTATLYIYNSKGEEVKKTIYELPNAIPTSPSGFDPKYDELSLTYLRANASYSAKIGVDNLSIAKTVRKPVTVSFDEAKVALKYDKKTLKNGGRVMVPYNSETPAVITVEPKNGAVIDKILLNGESIGTTAELTGITAASELKVLTEEAPVVESLTVDGVVQVGETLTANALITDVNDDVVSASYQWQVKNGSEWEDIENATAQTYIIPDTMLGKQLRVVVTPVSDTEPKTGTALESTETAAVVNKTIAPSAEKLEVSGAYDVSGKLTVTYDYIKSESNVEQGNSSIIFETADEENGTYTPVQDSSSKEYVIKNSDAGKWMRIRVIPKDLHGVAGAELVSDPVQISTKIAYFVATDGDDNNDGSIEKPFASIDKAKNTIRALNGQLPKGGVVVNIRGGVYPTKDTLKFDEVDSGTKDCPIVYQAYNGEKVVLSGGKTLDSSKIQKVTDPELLNGLVEEEAKDHLYMLDLKEQGVTMHELKPYGRGYSGYTPKMITMNNTVLTEARWPNDDQSQMLVTCRPLTKADGIDEDQYNAGNTPIKFEYPDPENRSAKWNVKQGDAYVGGAVVYFWAQVTLRIDNIDAENKVVTSLDASTYGSVKDVGWGPQHKVYFSNIFAEIDQPGEYYVDREKGIMYFYPIGDVENAEMSVFDSSATMLLADDLKYVTFKGLTMKDTSGALLYFRNSEFIRVEDSELCNAGSAISLNENTKNTVITGNHMYNLNGSAISISGGNLETLEPQNILIENNNLHTFSLLRTTPYGIYMTNAVGNTIRNNEFNDFCQGAMLLSDTVDTTIEYNKILNGAQSSTDMGAIYWGRNPISLGNKVKYNYFENIGSEQISHVLEGGHTYGIFNDDGTTGGYVFGNVFLDGGTNAAATGNGSEFGTYENNVFISTDTDRFNRAFSLNTWGSRPERYDYEDNGVTKKMKDKIPARVWLYLMDLRTPLVEVNGNTNLWEGRKDLAWSETWINHYAGTQWERPLTYYGKKNYEAVKAFADAGDRDGMIKYLDENLPAEWTNTVNNNLILNGLEITAGCGGIEERDNYKGTTEKLTAAEKAMFVDYDNKNFALTDAGLAEVRKSAPEFEQIPFEKIGLLTDVGGQKPVVTVNSEVISGTPVAGKEITASYTFSDADGDREATTKIYWYVSDTADGDYEKVQAAQGKHFTPTEEHTGKYLKYEVIPYDTHSLRGESVWSDPIAIETTDNALLSDLQMNGKTITNFSPNKANYMVTANEMPEITATAAAEGATVEITKNSETLPVKFTITVTALDGKTTKTYVVAVSSGTTATPSPTVTPTPTYNPGTNTGSTTIGTGSGLGIGIAGNIGSSNSGKNTAVTPSAFTDIIGHWAEKDIDEMADKGIVSGVTATTFEPDRSITRAEFAALMTRALKLSSANNDSVFADVASSAWYADEVAAAAATGLIVGYDGNFRPDDTITREEMAVIIMKAYVFLGKSPLTGQIDKFADKDAVSEWAVSYVDQAVSVGLISGMTADTFAPQENATRAQVTSLIKRLLNS